MFDKLKSIKKGYVKSRDKPDQSLPYAKVQKRGKWIRRFVKIALVLVGLSGAVAFIKASNVSQTNHKLKSDQENQPQPKSENKKI